MSRSPKPPPPIPGPQPDPLPDGPHPRGNLDALGLGVTGASPAGESGGGYEDVSTPTHQVIPVDLYAANPDGQGLFEITEIRDLGSCDPDGRGSFPAQTLA